MCSLFSYLCGYLGVKGAERREERKPKEFTCKLSPSSLTVAKISTRNTVIKLLKYSIKLIPVEAFVQFPPAFSGV
jgi:hypothetical protein